MCDVTAIATSVLSSAASSAVSGAFGGGGDGGGGSRSLPSAGSIPNFHSDRVAAPQAGQAAKVVTDSSYDPEDFETKYARKMASFAKLGDA